MSRFKTESDVADVVIAHLQDLRYEVYCEVEVCGRRVDVVAIRDGISLAVEVKRTCNFDVLGQASSCASWFHRSIAAFPFPKSQSPYLKICLSAVHNQCGIGVWEVSDRGIVEHYPTRLNRRARLSHIDRFLNEQQKSQRAGLNKGFWSPFSETKHALIAFVRKHQPCTLKESIEGIRHHYRTGSTAYSSLGKWIREGVIPEVEMTKKGLVIREC